MNQDPIQGELENPYVGKDERCCFDLDQDDEKKICLQQMIREKGDEREKSHSQEEMDLEYSYKTSKTAPQLIAHTTATQSTLDITNYRQYHEDAPETSNTPS